MSEVRIEKTSVLAAPRRRVWEVLSRSEEFGAWFRVAVNGAFVPRTRLAGPLTVTGMEHVTMEIIVERIEPERRAAASRTNERGGIPQITHIERYVDA